MRTDVTRSHNSEARHRQGKASLDFPFPLQVEYDLITVHCFLELAMYKIANLSRKQKQRLLLRGRWLCERGMYVCTYAMPCHAMTEYEPLCSACLFFRSSRQFPVHPPHLHACMAKRANNNKTPFRYTGNNNNNFNTAAICNSHFSVVLYLLRLRRHPLDVRDGDAGARGADAGQDLVVLLDIQDLGTAGADFAAGSGGLGIGEGDGAEVSKGNEGVAFLEVFNDPFGVGLAEGVALAGEGVGHGLAGADVLDGGRPGGLAGRFHGDGDRISGRDADTAEVVGYHSPVSGEERFGREKGRHTISRIPFVPSVVGDASIVNSEVDPSLQDSGLTSVTVDADPSGCGVGSAFRVARWDGWGRNSEGSGDGGVAAADEDGTCPILAVGDVGYLVCRFKLGKSCAVDGNVGVAATGGTAAFCDASGIASTASLGERGSQARADEQRAAEEGSSVLHVEER